jgi:hypothetical protein
MREDKETKMVIAWIDHEQTSLDEITQEIGNAVRVQHENMYVKDSCNLVDILIEARLEDLPPVLAERALARLAEKCPEPDLVFVDLSFGPSTHSDAVQKGRWLANVLQKKLYPIPVVVYSKHPLTPKNRAFISSDRFAAVLEKIRDLYETESLLDGDTWYALFEEIIRKSKDAAAVPPHALSAPIRKVEWKSGHPLNNSPSFREVALKLTAQALEFLQPSSSEIEISELSGGFSGSYVLKAQVQGKPAAFVIKIDEDPRKLEKELKGYQLIEGSVENQYYLSLPRTSAGLVKLYHEWWGAFAMSYEARAKPLLDFSQLESEVLGSIYRRVWEKCLYHLYGEVSEDKLEISDILTEKVRNSARDGLSSIIRYQNRIPELGGLEISSIENCISFLENTGQVSNDKISIPYVEQIHGDLNCRNILYDSEQNSFRLIDFPNVGTRSCFAVDFVKAEAELILIMMDWATGRDCDFPQIKIWASLVDAISKKFMPDETGLSDSEGDRIMKVVKAIRQTYINRLSDFADPMEAYRLYLIVRIISYLNYSDITVAKRVLALLWVGLLLKHRW